MLTGVPFALASAVLFGASAPLAKLLLGEIDPWLLAGVLYLGAGLGLAVARPWLRRFGICVTVACPGFLATGMSDHYEGWRPLEWSADKAARHIARAAARGRGRVDFPWPLVALIGLGKLAPRPLREAVRDLLFRLSVH